MITSEESLEIGKEFLDEATENLTFEEFYWAFEEVWHGVGWLLNAFRTRPEAALLLGEKGSLPRQGSLNEILGTVSCPAKAARIVRRLERLRQRLVTGTVRLNDHVDALVFEAWELHDLLGQRLHLEDVRLGNKWMLGDSSPGRVSSRVIERRTALKMLVAGSVLPLVACQKMEKDARAVAASEESVKPNAEGKSATIIKAVTPIVGMNWQTSDPFLFCAYHQDNYPTGSEDLGPAASLDGRHIGRDFEGKDGWRMYHGRTVPGFPRHPHRGFETVTVVRSGMLDHTDSLGATARYGEGDVQWLTSGRGIQHSEMFPLLRADAPNPLELFQIWMNLPREDKMVDPFFTMLWNEKIPRVSEVDSKGRIVELTVAAGAYKEHTPPRPPPNSWAARPQSDTAIWTIRMEANARFELPAVAEGTLRSVYVHRGRGATVGGQAVPNMSRVEVEEAGIVSLQAGPEETEILLLQARPIGEPVAKRGPFVMNTQDEIRQAYSDYQQTGFGGWKFSDDGPVHERQKGRFAIHADGRFEEPG